MKDPGLSVPLQENLLTLAIYNDAAAKRVRATVPVNLFTTRHYREIMSKVYDYVDKYGIAPRNHLADELDDILISNSEEGNFIGHALVNAAKLKDTLNEVYVLDQLSRFTRQQTLKIGIIDAHEKIQAGELDLAEEILQKTLRARSTNFDPGITLPAVVKLLKDGTELRDPIATGIELIDRLGLGPARQELHLFIGPPKRGKSWWLIHMVKRALMQRWRGIAITLEMSERLWGQRVLQCVSVMTMREIESLTQTEFIRDKKGRLESFDRRTVKPESLLSPGALDKVTRRVEWLNYEDRLLIKGFPPKSLTLMELEAYLDAVADSGFHPDFLVVDYPQLMKLDIKNYRLELGELMVNLRRVGVERNLAMIVAHQSNRPGASASLLKETHAAEDFSVIATSDCVFTYSQSKAEREWNLARLFVSNARNEADRFAMLLTQNYALGQFVLESMKLNDEYAEILKDAAGEPEEEESETD